MVRVQQTKHALGSEVVLTLVGANEQWLQKTIEELWQEIRLFEQTFSRFIADSELSYVNQRAGLPVEVGPEFIGLTEAAKEMSLRTDGLYDPFVLPALQRAGYKGSWPAPEISEGTLDFSSRDAADPADIMVTPQTVRLPANTALDFGGIGKGYLLDMLAERLQVGGCTDFWLSLGGDIVVQGRDSDGEAWNIGIASADATGLAAQIENHQGQRMAIATSGTIKRRGPGWHHLIDPRSGKPADTDVLTATVCLASAIEADVYAKCLVVLGSSGATAFMQGHAIATAVLQTSDKHDKLKIIKIGI